MNYTRGPWIAEKIFGWGDTLCIRAVGESKPMFHGVRPDAYFTEWLTVVNDDGSTAKILSEEKARAAGLYVATDEIRKQIEDTELANARLIAAAPDMFEALRSLENDAGQIPDFMWNMVQDAVEKAGGKRKT